MNNNPIVINLLVRSIFLLALATEVTTADPNLVADWKFDEGDGAVAFDSSGDNHGIIYGATWTTGQVNGALSFDGLNDYFEVSDNDSLDISSEITIGAWVNLSNIDNDYFILTKQPSPVSSMVVPTGTAPNSYPGNYEFCILPSGHLHFRYQTIPYGIPAVCVSTSSIKPGEWQHAVVSLAEGGNVNFFINGSPAGYLPDSGEFGVLNDEPLRIGTRKDSFSFFNGKIDDVFIFDRAISVNEINKRFNYLPYKTAWNPYPYDDYKGVNCDLVLSWWPGELAESHDVYFGTDEAAVTNADTNTPEIYFGRQNSNQSTYNLAEFPFEWGETYYWRIDEVNGPDIWKGDVWHFTWRSFEAAGDTACRIVSWNIQFLGTRNPPRTQEQLDAIARRILTFDASILALQEISEPSVLWYIRHQLGASWKIYQPGGENALLYDGSKVEMITGESLNSLDNPPYSSYPGASWRRPVSGIFLPVGTCTKPFRVIGVHCHWADANVRASEGTWLNAKISEFLDDPEEPKDIILLGDFNGFLWMPPHTQFQEDILHLVPIEATKGNTVDWCYVSQEAKAQLIRDSTFVITPEHYGETIGDYQKTYSDHYPIFIDFQPKISTYVVEDFETNDFSQIPWESTGDSRWTITSSEQHSGNYSAQAGDIDHDESTMLRVTLDCMLGHISFFRKVSSESRYDYLAFYIEGVEQDRWSGKEDWAIVSFPVTEGRRTFEWTYSKDGSNSDDDDTAWIDDIAFPTCFLVVSAPADVVRADPARWEAAISDANPLHWYKFNETGTECTDSGSRGLSGTYDGVLLGEEGLFGTGTAVGFARIGDICVNFAGAMNLPGPWTVEYIVKTTKAPGAYMPQALHDSDTTSIRLAGWTALSEAGFTVYGVADYRFTPVIGLTLDDLVIQQDVWMHLAWRNNGSGTQLFFDGALVGTSTNMIELPRVRIGGRSTPYGTHSRLQGILDEAVVFDRALTDTEILTHALTIGMLLGAASEPIPENEATDIP